jgi:hypothetical protein
MLNWAKLNPNDRSRYADKPFSGPEHELSDDLIRNVKRVGFDFVRLTVDPGPFIEAEGDRLRDLDLQVILVVTRFLHNGLSVILNLHANTQVPIYNPDNWLRSVDDPIFVRYVAVVHHMAELLAKLHSSDVALEPINEPSYGYDRVSAARWQQMCELLHDAARSASPDLLILLSGAQGGSSRGLIELNAAPFAGSRVRYSFHYYEPHIFTHQGVEAKDGARMWGYFSGIPYPARRVPAALVLGKVKENVLERSDLSSSQRQLIIPRAQAEVSDYLMSRFDVSSIEASFDGVADWARRNGLPPKSIILGEFGVTRTYGGYRAADQISREAWLNDVRQAAEHRGFAWSLWLLSGYGGMALVERDGAATLDPSALRALGLGLESRR